MLLWLLFQGYALFSDDGAIRLALADEWAAKPFVASQIPWLPLQFYVVGLLSQLTTLPAYSLGIGLNMVMALLLPWVFSATLPKDFDEKKKIIALYVMALWPWTVWLGVSGLSEPLMWVLALGLLAAYQRKHIKSFVLCALLLSMCRIEAWLWVALLGGAWVFNCFKNRKNKEGVVLFCLLAIFPLLWGVYQYSQGHLDSAASMRIAHASKDDAAPLKPILFFVIAFFAAPFWLFFLPALWKARKQLKKEKLILFFVVVFYLSTVIVGLATAVPQRNLVFPLLLVLPFLVEKSKWSWRWVIVLQLMVLFHPQHLLRKNTCTERRVLAQNLENIKGELNEGEQIMLCLEDDPHRYLGNHLAHLTNLKEVLKTDTQPADHYDQSTYPFGGKYIIYEHFENMKEPLTNYWRSYNKGESVFEKRNKQEIVEVLKANKIKIAVTGRQRIPLHLYGYEVKLHNDPFTLYVYKGIEEQTMADVKVTAREPSRKKTLMRLKSGKFDREVLSAFMRMIGL